MSVPATKELTEKQEAFALAFARNGGNATQAAIEAGYSEKSARCQGQQLKALPHVQQRIAQECYSIQASMVPLVLKVQREILAAERGSAMVKHLVAADVLDRVTGKAVQRVDATVGGELTVRIDLS